MGILFVIAIGVGIGWGSALVLPRTQRVGAPIRALFGVAGAMIGGFLSCALTLRAIGEVRPTTLLGSAIGAAVVLLVASRAYARRAHRTAI